MRPWLIAVALLSALAASSARAQGARALPVAAPAPRLLADARLAAPLLAAAPEAGAPDFAPCVSEEEVRAAAPGQRWRAFRRSAVPLPPLLYLSQDRTFMQALLLYWSSTNVEERTKLRLLLPVFLWSCTPRSRTLVTPLFAYRDDEDGRAGFVGPYYYRRDRHAQSDVLFPLFARLVDRDATTIVALNLYHHRTARGAHGGIIPFAFWGSDRDGSYAVVPPLVFHFADRRATTTVVPPFYLKLHRPGDDFDVGLAPLYFGARHGDDYADVVPPLLLARWGDRRETNLWWLTSYYHRDPRGWAFGVAPLYFGGRRGASYHHVVLPPLFARWGDARGDRTMVLNTYVWQDRRSDDWFFFFIPAAFGFRSGKTLALVSPLVTHVSRPGSTTTVVPPVYHHRDRHALHLGAFPLFLHGQRDDGSSYTHLPPLLFFDTRDRRGAFTWALTGYYRRAYLPDGSVDPRDWDAGVAPLWFQGRDGGQRYLYVPPLLLFDRENEAAGSRFTLFPVGYRYRDRRTSAFGFVPFYFEAQSGADWFWFAPLLASAQWGDAVSETTVIGPYFRRRAAVSFHQGVVPFFFQGHTPTIRYTVIPFLPFWYQRDPDRELLVVGPVFHSRTPGAWDTGVFPLVFTGRAGPRHYLALPPLVTFDWGDEAAGTRTTLFPVGYRYRHPGGWHFGLVPLLFASRHGAVHRTLLPPLLTFHWGDGVEERTIVGGLGYSARSPGARHYGLVPLFFAGSRDATHPQGPMSYQVLAPPLYIHHWSLASETTVALQTYTHTTRDGSWHGGSIPFYVGGRVPATGAYYDLVLPPLVVRFGSRAGDYDYLHAGPVYYSRRGRKREWGIAPIYAAGRNLRDGSYRYDFVLPPLFMRWESRTERGLIVFPFYDLKRRTERETAFLPLYFRGRDRGRGSFYDVALPFFARWGDRHRRSTLVLNTYYSSGRDGYDLVVAPFLFHGRQTNGNHHTFVPPVLFHWGGRREEGTLLFPLFFTARHRDHYARAVTPLFWQWGDRREGHSLLFPLAYLQRSRRGSLFLSPLVVAHTDVVAHEQRLVVFPLFWRFSSRDSDVNVAFPFWWDFDLHRARTRVTVLLPFGFRREKGDETTTMVLNVLLTRGRGSYADAWSFHLFPLIELSHYNPDHFKWQVLLGLLGRERQGRLSRWRIAYFWTDPS